MATIKANDRGSSGWVIAYYDLNGKRRRKVVHCSKKEAEVIAADIEAKKTRFHYGIDKTVGENFLFKDAIKYYFSQTDRADDTEMREMRVYKPFMKFIGIRRIRDIDRNTIIKYLEHRKQYDQLKDSTLGIEFRTLRAFFNFFVKDSHLETSPMKGMKAPKVTPKNIRFLSMNEIDRLLEVIDNPNIRDLVLMYIHTGARRLEILRNNFTWDNVDFTNKKVSLLGKGNKLRSVPMDEVAYEILYRRKYSEQHEIPFDYDYDWIYRRIKMYYEKADIKDANIHCLRRTFGSLVVQQGISIFTVAKLMGHSTVLVTEKHYASLLDKNLREGVDSLNGLGIK